MLTADYKSYQLKFKKPAGTSRGPLSEKTTYFIHLSHPAEPERIGRGEASPQPGLSVDDGPTFAPKLAEVCAAINQGTHPRLLLPGLADWPTLRFGLEMALLDWETGGQQRWFNTPFSRGEAGLPLHGLIWMGEPAQMLAQVADKVAQGASVIKMKIGALPFETELRLLADLRRAYPAEQIQLRLDANGAFQPKEALAKLRALAEFDIFALEQPLSPQHPAALADVCAASPIPIALDESLLGHHHDSARADLLRLINPAYIVLKPTLLGGFKASESWIAHAQARGIGWWVNSMLESSLGLLALAQWASELETRYPIGQRHGAGAVQGLGTNQLFSNNLPSSLHLKGLSLWADG